MKLIFYTEARFIKVGKNYYSSESSFSYSLFKRYLQYFDEVVICARVKEGFENDVLPQNIVNKENVDVYPLPYYVGFNAFLKKYFALKKSIETSIKKLYVKNEASVLCRVPGRIGAIAIKKLKKKGIPYGIEVVGDPYDVLSNSATNHPLAPIIRLFSYRSLKNVAYHSPAALYVTDEKLQERYPNAHFNIGVSDVVMPEDAFVENSLSGTHKGTFQLICVGSLDQMYKAPDVMIKALGKLIQKGIDVHLNWVGDGKFRPEMEELASQVGVQKNITFHGKLPGNMAVRAQLDKANLFVMPSRMEGLPRAMVEAMARALPCVGTKICGIQELLEKKCLVDVNDIDGLAIKIEQFINDTDLLSEQSAKNLKKSLNSREEILKPKRDKFYNTLKSLR